MMVGRKWIFRPLVESLDDDELYHVAKILAIADSRRLFEHDFPDRTKRVDATTARKNRVRARNSLAKMAAKLGEPDGENEVSRPYRAFLKAWRGSKWKSKGRN